MKCGTRGAREVCLDCSNGTNLLLHIRRDGQRSSEDWEAKLLGAEVLEHQFAGLGVTAKSAADELGTVGGTGPGGDTPQGPGLECELAERELMVVRSREPVLDDHGGIPCILVNRVPGLRWSLLLDGCQKPRDERILRRRRAAEDGDISRGHNRPVVGHITVSAGTRVPAVGKELGQLGDSCREDEAVVHTDCPGGQLN